MNKLSTLLIASGLAMSATVWAADTNTSSATAPDTQSHSLRTATLGVSPQVGVMAYKGTNGSYSTRSLAGLAVDGNIGKSVFGDNESTRDLYLGVTTGVFYSRVGSTSANFFGSEDQNDQTSTSIVIIPTDVKIGYFLSDAVRVAVHGGGNLIYSNAGQAQSLGLSGNGDSSWKYYLNAGADLDVALSTRVSVVARPDFTFVKTGEALFSGTLGVNVSML